MKTNHFLRLGCTVFAISLSLMAVKAEKNPGSGPVLPPSDARISISVTTIEPATAAESFAVASDGQWIAISDCTSEMRDRFFAGFQQIDAKLANQIDELTARRAAASGPTATADLDFAINEMRTARFFLQLTGETLRRATTQTWDQQKAKVGLAWAKSQEAYRKLELHSVI